MTDIKVTATQLSDKIVEEFQGSSFAGIAGEFQEALGWRTDDSYDLEGLTLSLVDQHGGEGEGDEYYVVFYAKETNQYFRFDGTYSSWDGRDYDSSHLYEVRPVDRVVTFYE